MSASQWYEPDRRTGRRGISQRQPDEALQRIDYLTATLHMGWFPLFGDTGNWYMARENGEVIHHQRMETWSPTMDWGQALAVHDAMERNWNSWLLKKKIREEAGL